MTQQRKALLLARLEAESIEIKQKFATLVARTEKCLENSDTTAANLKTLFNACSEELADIVNLTDEITEIMSKATRGKYWTFFNYGLLESVINAYCRQLITELQEYVIDFKEYCKRRLYEIPCEVLQADLRLSDSQSILCVKFDDKFSTDKPVTYFLQIQHNLSKILKIEPLHLVHVKDGCIELTFRYFTKQNIIPYIDKHQQDKLEQLGVLRLRCGKQELHLKGESADYTAAEKEKHKKKMEYEQERRSLLQSHSAPGGTGMKACTAVYVPQIHTYCTKLCHKRLGSEMPGSKILSQYRME